MPHSADQVSSAAVDSAPLPEAVSEPRPSRRPWLWLALPLVAVLALAMTLRPAEPSQAAWQSAVDALTELRPGDAIWVHPVWEAAPWSALESVALSAGLPRGQVFLHADRLTTADVARYRRVWLVGRASDPVPEALGGVAETVAEQGGVRVAVADVPTARLRTDFLAVLGSAHSERATVEGRVTPCRWDKDRFRCDARDWTQVRPVMAEVGGTRRRCVYGQPDPDRGVLRVRFPAARLGDRLAGGVGLNLWANRHEEGSDVRFVVRVGGDVLVDERLPRGDFTWHTFDVDTSGRGKADVTFEVSAESTAWRQTCWDAVAF